MLVNPFAPHPFVTPTSMNNRDLLTDAVFELLERVGISDLTTGSLGRSMKMTAQAVLKRAGGRDRLDRMVVCEFSRRWSRWCLSVPPQAEVPVALPRDEIELHAITVWHAFSELARGAALAGHPEPAADLDQARAAERAHLANVLTHRLGHQPSQCDLDGLVAIADGLRAGLARTAEPLSIERAENAVRSYLAAVTLMTDSG